MTERAAPDSPRSPAPIALWAAALALPLAYFWWVGRYGWSDTDDGFVLGSAWRVVGGEVPYRDFLDVRPPTSAFLHGLWFVAVPRPFAFAAARLGAVVETWAFSLAAAVALARAAAPRPAGWSATFAVATAGFLLSASAFTPMPWHTTDGLLFSALAAALLVAPDRRPWAAGLAGVLVVLAMGAKQSFYPVAPLALAYLLAARRLRCAAVFAAAIAAGGALFVAWLAASGALQPFLAQTTARTGLGYIWTAGVSTYLGLGLPIAAEAAGVAALAWLAARLAPRRFRRGWVVVALLLVALVDYAPRLRAGAWVNASTLGYPHALFMAAVAVALWRSARRETRGPGLAALLFLGLAWCASLSIGFPTPILFLAPVMAVLALDPTAPAGRTDAALAWTAAALAAALAGLAALHPYEELDPRNAQNCPLARVEPHLRLIVSGPRTCAKLAVFARLRRAYPGPFVTLPAFDMAYVFAGVQDPIGADWPTLAEDAGQSARLISEADARVTYAFVEEAETRMLAGGDQAMPLLDHIRARWTRLPSQAPYAVYRNPAR